MLWHAYVDETGDRGWKERPPNLPPGKKGGSSRIFSATAVLVPDGVQTTALAAWDQSISYTNRPGGSVIHWHDVKGTGPRKLFTKTVAEVPRVQVISVVLCKWHLPNATKIREDPEYLYFWTLRLLVERISWFGETHNTKVKMNFAQVTGIPPGRLQSYLSKLHSLGQQTWIKWDHLLPPPRVDTPKNRRMLQLADSAASSVGAAFEPDNYGFRDQAYLELLKPVLWCPHGRRLQKYGLKFGPWESTASNPPAACLEEYPWLPSFCS